MNPGLASLQPYPFERLAALRAGVQPNPEFKPINLSIGEPQHATPRLVLDALIGALEGTAKYPATKGSDELRHAIARWLERRFRLPSLAVDADSMVLPAAGTREALFAIAQCVVSRDRGDSVVAMPNPFYQIYEGAALLAGAQPYFMHCPPSRGFLPDFSLVPESVWRRCELVYICSPANPSGAVMELEDYHQLLALADRHDFVVVSDECYSELYYDEARPPLGLLQAAHGQGRTDFRRCLVMHSLSKRSNAPGLRSGFIAGDPLLMREFLRYRTYHGAALPMHVQAASVAAWQDEIHVIANRARYREKFDAVVPLLSDFLDVAAPAGGFYLWPRIGGDDTAACVRLLAEANVLTLPGSFLAREVDGHNPGAGRLRLALVASLDECVDAARRLRQTLTTL